MEPKPLVVGSVVYALDRDRRYGPDKEKDPIIEWTIVGETRVSWLIKRYLFKDGNDAERFDYKLPKKPAQGDDERTRTIHVSRYGSGHQTFYFDRETLVENMWWRNNRYAISREVERIQDPKVLRQVAALINYADKK